MAIITNKLNFSYDAQAFEQKYEIFVVKTSEDYFKSGSYVLDLPELGKHIVSIRFYSGKEIYVLMNKAENNKYILVESLKTTKEYPMLSVQRVSASNIDRYILLQLLLNGLGNFEMDLLRFNNLTGRLYCFNTAWFERSKKSDGENILKVPTLEVRVDENVVLHLDVHTFTSELLKKKIEFKKKKYDAYPKYVLSNNKTLRRKLSGEEGNEYIMRQTRNCKREIPFLNIHDINGFNESKMGVLQDILERFHKRYKDIATISFEEIKEYGSIDYTRVAMKEDKARVLNALSSIKIKIIDKIEDQYSAEFISQLKELFKVKYNHEVEIGKRLSKDYVNIVVIHNVEYYEEGIDPYENKYEEIAVQHVTLEDFASHASAAVQTIVHELLIKQDLVNNEISLFDWNNLGLTETISFGINHIDSEEKEHYVFMSVKPDGSFEIKEQELNLFEEAEYDDCVDIFSSSENKTIRGIIKSPTKGVNIISDTGIITFPDNEVLKELLKAGDNKLRGKERRDELLPGVLDIKYYENGDSTYYFVGTIGNGMRWKIDRAVNVREIKSYNSSELFFKELLPTMNISFVKNGQLTVVPFPFKYLREYCKTNY